MKTFFPILTLLAASCSVNNYGLCKKFVDKTNEQLRKCSFADGEARMTYEGSCPNDINSPNINCTRFYACMELSVQCTEQGIAFSDVPCPPCELDVPS